MEGPLPEAVDVNISADGGSQVSAPVLQHVYGNVSISNYYSGGTQPAPPMRDSDQHLIAEYKTSILTAYETVEEYNALPGQDVLLADRYTELLIIQKHRNQSEREEELRSRGDTLQQVFKTRASETHSRIHLDQLFKPKDCGSVPRAVILQGHSGHGKSFTVKKIMHDWASELFKDFILVFHLNCKELNLLSGEHSVVDLLRCDEEFTPVILRILRDSPGKVLFVIDGFDELRFSLNEITSVLPSGPSVPAPIEATLSALLKGIVLRQSVVLVTTRSTVSDKLSEQLKTPRRFTEILGFSEDGVKEYFQRFFDNTELSNKVYEHVRSNETLFTSCFTPVICWIVCTVFREHFQEAVDKQGNFETTSSIFVHFINTLMEYHCEGLSQLDRTLLRSLSQLAERGIREHQVLFNERTVSEEFPDFNKGNPFLCKFLMKKKVYRETMYSFMHLSFQEFFAALYYILIDDEKEAGRKLQMLLQFPDEVDSFRLFKENRNHVVQFPNGVDSFRLFKENRSHVVQFLFGLSNNNVHSLVKTHSWVAVRAQVKEWLLNLIKTVRLHTDIPLFVLHCLYEIHEEEFVMQVIGSWGEISLNVNQKRINCWVLLYCLQCCPSIRQMILYGLTADNLRMLQPALDKCDELGFNLEVLSDSDVDDLISALGGNQRMDALRIMSTLSAESVEHILKALQKIKYLPTVSLYVNMINHDIITMSLRLIQTTEISKFDRNLLRINWPNMEGHCSSLYFQKYANSLRLYITIDPVMVPETVISRIALTFLHSPKTAIIDFKDFVQELHILRGLREKPAWEKHMNALLSVLRSLPGLREVELTVDRVTEGLAVDILSSINTCPNLNKLQIKKEPPHWSDWFTNGTNSDLKSFCSVLSVEKDFSKQLDPKLKFSVKCRDGTLDATLTLAYVSNSAINFHNFLQKFHTLSVLRKNSSGCDEHVDALISSLNTLPGLEQVDLTLSPLTVSWVTGSLSIFQTCPSLQRLQINRCSFPSGHLFVTKNAMNRYRLDEIGFFRLDVKMSLESKNFDMMLDSSGMAIQLTESSAGSDELAFALLSSLCPMLGLREVKLRVHLLTVFWAVRGLSLIQTCPSLQKLQISKRRSSPTTSVSKDAISLSLEDVSDSDVGDLISALGEGKKIKELRLTGSLSTESVECILRTLQKQKCVGMVDLQVNTITLHIDAMRLHLLQILEMSQSYKYLCIDEKCDWNQLTNETDGDAEGLCSGLSVKKDFKDFSFSVRGRDGTTGATLPLASELDINFQEFLQNFLLGKEESVPHPNLPRPEDTRD
ncbi:NACHT, LRR and PYD domains-containing protein 1 homolog isoform X2 [Alosa alosa]|uniref:NACHT, LRR and PYD domains-containing protein 1 homolog isoform X2 n=1 Tax=Alosa alosa TaxID=278164 RepID=UPI0020154D58|nr:NACHT, LRR and PYD domains-containing protein 1 homolog isoform X2 [Alosa alosa]